IHLNTREPPPVIPGNRRGLSSVWDLDPEPEHDVSDEPHSEDRDTDREQEARDDPPRLRGLEPEPCPDLVRQGLLGLPGGDHEPLVHTEPERRRDQEHCPVMELSPVHDVAAFFASTVLWTKATSAVTAAATAAFPRPAGL